MQKAYSTIEIKEVDKTKRIIRGIASAPSTDRMGDIVEPEGAEYNLPIPLLWQHNHDQPIGYVTQAKVTKKGIEVVAELVTPTNDMPNGLFSRLSEAWASITSGLVRGLSIGFTPLEYSFIDGGGVRFSKWDWHELSAVTIPANADATITTIKKISDEQRAALGNAPVVKQSPVVAGEKAVKITNKTGVSKMNYSEKLKGFIAAQQEKSARMASIMEEAGDLTLSKEQAEEYDTLRDEVKALETHIKRFQELEAVNKATATPVSQDPRNQAAAQPMEIKGMPSVQAKNTEKLEGGIAFARAAKCLAIGFLQRSNAVDIAKSVYGDRPDIVAVTEHLMTKAAVPYATTTNATYAAPLIGNDPLADFVEHLRPRTILGAMPGLRNIGFRLPIVGQTSGGDGYWVGEGGAKPLTKFDFNKTQLDPLKVANIAVLSMEVVRDSRPAADVIIRDQLAAALRERLDKDFVDPAKAAVANISPASILNGVTPVVSSGTDADAIRADVRALYLRFIAANNAPTSGVWLMDAVTALALSMMQNPLGQAEFPGITMNGGTFQGLPVVVSEYMPRDSSGSIVALVNASDIYIGDEGGIAVDMSTEASLQMSDTPDNVPTATTVTVNLWQHNLIGFRAERTINWAKRRPTAAQYLSGVNWGA